jgi:hypothetical protein
MREIKEIIFHCSASSFGDGEEIDRWHKDRGWDGIGYHFVILNGFRSAGKYNAKDDGIIEVGRPIEKAGAHCKGRNSNSIGVCLIGNNLFSANQLYVAIPTLIKMIDPEGKLEIHGHNEFSSKTCPNIDIDTLKNFLNNRMVK